jgi:hypothetical protein
MNWNDLVLVIVAVLSAFTAFMNFRTQQLTQDIKKHTNSMMTALVKSEKKTSHAEGLQEGRDENHSKPK